MPKDVATLDIKEGGQLMDPTGKEFQALLAQSQSAAVEKLATKLDTSMVEEKKDDKQVTETKPASSAVPAKEEEETEEAPGDDIGNLKNQVSGLKAELARVRKNNSGSADEAQLLKERIADMEGQMKVLREGKTANSVEDKMSRLTDDQVADNKVAWDDELSDARVVARLAERDGDAEKVKEANARIQTARAALGLYSKEERRRLQADSSKASTDREDREGLVTETETLFTDLYKAAPDLQDKTSDIWKAGQVEYSKMPKLMKAMGPLGELIAVANAIAKNPQLIGKKVISAETGKVLSAIEDAADKSFQKGGAAPTKGSFTPVTTIRNQTDHAAFEEMVRKVKSG